MNTKTLSSPQPEAVTAAKPGGMFGPLTLFKSEMQQLFDRFFSDPWGHMTELAGPWMPTMDLKETENEITVRLEVPGVDPQEIEVSLTGDMLTVAGEKKETREEKDEGGYEHKESYFGSFRRSIALPTEVDTESIVAEHRQGVLTVTMKKVASATPKRIEVKSAN